MFEGYPAFETAPEANGLFEVSTPVHNSVGPQHRFMWEQGGATSLSQHVVADYRALFGCFISSFRDVKIVVAGTVTYAQRRYPPRSVPPDLHGISSPSRNLNGLQRRGRRLCTSLSLMAALPKHLRCSSSLWQRDGAGLETASREAADGCMKRVDQADPGLRQGSLPCRYVRPSENANPARHTTKNTNKTTRYSPRAHSS